MTIPLDNAAKDFQEMLRRKASAKMVLVRAAKERKRKEREKAPPPTVQASVLAKLNEILVLLKQGNSTGPVNFIVTERDGDGKIKSFKVEA
jgi:hypothetical protein